MRTPEPGGELLVDRPAPDRSAPIPPPLAATFANPLMTTNDEQRREITELQQRARSLEAEIQHRKELEKALREALMREKEARGEAERSARFNEMFAGMLGHDLRNPLGSMITGTQLVMLRTSDEKITGPLQRVLSSGERLGSLWWGSCIEGARRRSS